MGIQLIGRTKLGARDDVEVDYLGREQLNLEDPLSWMIRRRHEHSPMGYLPVFLVRTYVAIYISRSALSKYLT